MFFIVWQENYLLIRAQFTSSKVAFQQTQTNFVAHTRNLILGVCSTLAVVIHCNTEPARIHEVEFSDTPFHRKFM